MNAELLSCRFLKTPPRWCVDNEHAKRSVKKLTIDDGLMPNNNSPSVAAATVDEYLATNGVLKTIRTDGSYREALKQIKNLMMAEPDTAEGKRLDAIITVVGVYESKHQQGAGSNITTNIAGLTVPKEFAPKNINSI